MFNSKISIKLVLLLRNHHIFIIIQGEFFILRHQNISRNTHRTEKRPQQKPLIFKGQK